MRSDGEGLLAAIMANPADDTPRLAYADWCDENDQPERAEFIRLQIELATQEKWQREKGLYRREEELILEHGQEWILPLARRLGVPETPGQYKGNRFRYIGTRVLAWPSGREVKIEWRRGFPEVETEPAEVGGSQ